jgi:AcrR family transcriptional regulator
LLILEASRGLFAAKGFRGTSTREIAEAAGVAEILLFRNFGSKAELYSSAVVLPLTEFFERWVESDWSGWDEANTAMQQREFISRLYHIVRENRGLIVSYLGLTVFEPEMMTGLGRAQALDEMIDRLAAQASEHSDRLGRSAPNARVGTRAVIGMIVAMALFNNLGRGDGAAPTSDDVIDEMTQLVLHGSWHRQGPPGLNPT